MQKTLHHTLLYGLLPAVILIAVVSGGSAFYAQAYSGKILPGVHVGPIDVGGMTHEEAALKLAEAIQSALKDGLTLSVDGQTKTIPLVNDGVNDPDASFDLITWNIDEALSQAVSVGRERSVFVNLFAPIFARVTTPTVPFSPQIDAERIEASIFVAFPEVNRPATNAAFDFTQGDNGWEVTVVPSQSGQVIEISAMLEEAKASLESELFLPALIADVVDQEPTVSDAEADSATDEAKAFIDAAPYRITYKDVYGERVWKVEGDMLDRYLIPADVEGEIEVVFDPTFADGLRELTADVLTKAEDAKFVIVEGKVQEFQGSQPGVDLDVEAMFARLLDVAGTPDSTVELAVIKTDPTIATGEVNDLGITEIIGVGVSNFSGSPTNRIKNIKNGARILNGTLIKPGDTFSLLNTLRPFTLDNGYLPELVIKGDKIEPEVGGGLCQIGTTTFRATMNSGLPVLERRNHSLVVSYYNDPRNRAPGTDATIYDPSPDFKFLNDTGHYILITTDVNTQNGQLTFTFWGTSDGRTGAYTVPIVSSWIPAGPTRNIETLDLEPGKTKCQGAHPGANASFTYSITRADGTVEEQIFTSSYRALPEICLVGVEKLTEEAPATAEEQDPLVEEVRSSSPIPDSELTTLDATLAP